MSNERIEQYELGRALGRGGMGEVFEARDTRLDRRVAIKLIPEERAKDRVARGRFHREARIASSLNHPHICTIHDFGESAGRLYLAMELLEGQGLDARIASKSLTLADTIGGIFTPEIRQTLVEYALQIAEGPPPEELPLGEHPAVGTQLLNEDLPGIGPDWFPLTDAFG